MADYFNTVDALDDLHSKAVKKAAGIKDKEKEAAPAGVDHVKALDDVETEMYKLRETGRGLMKKNLQDSPEYEELIARSKFLRRKKAFLEDSSKDE